MNIKALLHKYLNRRPITPIPLPSFEHFYDYLIANAKPSASRTARKPVLDGFLASGCYFYERNGFLVIRYEKRFGRTDWHFAGEVQQNDSGTQLVGQYKVSSGQEFISVLALPVSLYALMALVGVVSTSVGTTALWVALVLPLIIYAYRWLDGTFSVYGLTGIARVEELLNNYIHTK